MAETLNKAIKAVTAYAKANGQDYIQVEQIYESRLKEDEYKGLHFRAYINDFSIFTSSPTIAGLIEQFEAVKSGIKPRSTSLDDLDLDLPF